MKNDSDDSKVTRRETLTATATTVGVLALYPGDLAKLARQFKPTTAAACLLTPEQEQGPYYVDGPLVRRDIRDKKPGIPMILAVSVVDTKCSPLANAAVDVWHADAAGAYSKDAGALRGVQLTNKAGRASFQSVFPGWYPNRAIHVHVKVRVGGKARKLYGGGHTSHTGNIFVAESVSKQVEQLYPYHKNPVKRVLLNDDFVFQGQSGKSVIAKAKPTVTGDPAKGFQVGITLMIDPKATPGLVGIH